MADKNTVLKLGIDAVEGRVAGEFSVKEAGAGFVEGLIELNGGSSKINFKTFHRGNAVFDVIEEILPYITASGIHEDAVFMNLVEERNVKEGDEIEFVSKDKSLFIVSNIANGSQAIRRQRLNAGETVTIPTQMRAVEVYEEARRLLSGRVDFTVFVDRVSRSFIQKIREDMFNAFNGITASTAGLSATYVQTGTFAEDTLLDLISHVEAETGMAATIFGTKKALRKITNATLSDDAKNDLYHLGYMGTFAGTPMVSMRQMHKAGTDTFVLNDSKVYVIATNDKPIKFVNEGDGILIEKQFADHADMTQSYLYGQAYGCAVLCNEKMGLYTISVSD